jgi:hypothetical protein
VNDLPVCHRKGCFRKPRKSLLTWVIC